MTPYQQIACIRRTGLPFILKPYEEILVVKETDDSIVVSVRAVVLEERTHGDVIKATGYRMHRYSKCEITGGWKHESVTVWDAEPDVTFMRRFGRADNPVEARERRLHELDCHRPGASRYPLDNADRTFLGAEHSTPRMKKHWGVNY